MFRMSSQGGIDPVKDKIKSSSGLPREPADDSRAGSGRFGRRYEQLQGTGTPTSGGCGGTLTAFPGRPGVLTAATCKALGGDAPRPGQCVCAEDHGAKKEQKTR